MSPKKTISRLLSFFVASIILFGCESKQAEISSTSPDGTTKITITGNKSFMEPWDLTIAIEGKEKKDDLKTQMYADEINNKNIIFNWQDNQSCTITFIEQDDTQRTVQIEI
jgi:hypothetical protein